MQKASKIFSLSTSVLLVVVLVTPLALARPTRLSSFAHQDKAADPVTIQGTVAAVTESSLTVVDSNKVEQVIAIDANTKITKAGKAATAADIKTNDAVAVVASKGEGTGLTAVSIKIG